MSSERRTDEGYLALLALRHEGHDPKVIARMCGVTPAFVRSVTTRIRKADREESGEDVDWAYWPERAATPRVRRARPDRSKRRTGWSRGIAAMLREGLGVEDIALAMDAPAGEVRREINRLRRSGDLTDICRGTHDAD